MSAIGQPLILLGEGNTMGQIELYRQSASECLALAKRADDPECRALLIALASRLLDLSRPKRGISGPERPWKNRSRQNH